MDFLDYLVQNGDLPKNLAGLPVPGATPATEPVRAPRPAAASAPAGGLDFMDFLEQSKTAAPPPAPAERTGWEAVKDTGAQLAEGANTVLGAVPNLIAPEGKVAQFFSDNADYWRDMQSEPLKARAQAASAKIDEAGQNGIIAQIVEAAKQYTSDPGLAARFVTTNLPSMIPGIGAAKVAQAAALARGATAVRAGTVATGAAAGANAVLNAGGARGEGFEDIRDTLIKQGVPPEEATDLALRDSRVIAAVGGLAGAPSGATGLEKSLINGAARAAQRSVLAAGAKSVGVEFAGEQVEEVAPKLTTNYQAGQYDNRSLGQDVGRTIVETAIGSGPGAVAGGIIDSVGQASANAMPQPDPETTPPASDPITDPIQEIAGAKSVDEVIAAATSGLDRAMAEAGTRRAARQADIARQSEQEMMVTTQQRRDAEQAELDDLIATESQSLKLRRGFAIADQLTARQRAAEEQTIVDESRQALGALPEQQVAAAASADETGQMTAMQLAMQRARQRLSQKAATSSPEWQAFAPETGTIGIPRAEMPQIKAEHRGAMVNFMNARGVAHQEEMAEAADLKPTQAEYSPAKVQQAKDFTGGNRAILVSQDGHVLDGHHQLLAAQEQGIPVRIIRLDAPINRLVKLARDFPSSSIDESSQNQPAAPDTRAQAAIESVAPENVQNPPVRPSGQAETTTEAAAAQAPAPARSGDEGTATTGTEAGAGGLDAAGVVDGPRALPDNSSDADSRNITPRREANEGDAASTNGDDRRGAALQFQPARSVVGKDGKRGVPTSGNGPERGPGLQRVDQGDARTSAGSAGSAAEGLTPESARQPQGKQVSFYPGKYGKGMGKEAAKLEAQRLNRVNAGKGITYAAEEHNDPKLENPYAVVGRKPVSQPKQAPAPAPQAPEATEKIAVEEKPTAEASELGNLSRAQLAAGEAFADATPAAHVAEAVRIEKVAEGLDKFPEIKSRYEALAESHRAAAERKENAAPQFSRAAPEPASAAEQAAAILDAAAVTGKDRLEALLAVKAGTITPDELQAAYPAKTTTAEPNVQFSRGFQTEEANALEAISQNNELFALPKSEASTVEEITAENDPAIKVKKSLDATGRTDYKFTLPNGKTANLIVRRFNPYATSEVPTIYGYDLRNGEMENLALERPGTNPDDVGAVDDVWIDASNLDSGGFGAVLYNIAATYAHNTGRKFIGDPAGLSDDALRRRTEQMLSSALKFGTTEHLAPHPRQVRGDKALGIPPLKWTYGDDLGNIRALAETSIANYSDVNPVTFEPSTGRYLDSEGGELDDDTLRQIAEVGPGREAGAGLTTLKRNAVLAALVREESSSGIGRGQRAGLLGKLVELAGESSASTRGLFYSEGSTPAVRNPSTVASVQAAVAELIGGKWLPNKLGRVVVTTAAEIKSYWEPQIGQNVQLGSEGEAGQAQAFYDPRSRIVFLIADNIPAGDEMAVLAHELMHKHGQAVLGKDGWDKLHTTINGWANAPEDSDERAVYNYARSRVEAVGMELSSQEMFPYAVEAAIKMGVKPSVVAKKGTVARWLASVKFAMQQAWGKVTGKPGTFKTQDLVDLAFGIAQMENPESAAAMGKITDAPVTTDSPEFERWFGDSKVVDTEGKPQVVYHGTSKAFNKVNMKKGAQGLFWMTTDKAAIEAGEVGAQGRGAVMDLYARIEKPAGWKEYEQKGIGELKRDGYDGIILPDSDGSRTVVVFEPTQVKSASRNKGAFDPANPDIRFSRTTIVAPTKRVHTPAQLAAMKNVGFQVEEPTMKERMQGIWKDIGKKMAQGIVDQFAPVKDLDKEAYGLMRLSKGASGAFEVFLNGGKLKLTDNTYDFDDNEAGGVVQKLLIPLQGEHQDFMRWIAANRAEKLAGEGRENLFTPADINALKTLASGTTDFDYTVQTGPAAGRVTRDRSLIYGDSLRIFNGFNKNVLDMAEQSGLIDGASRTLWESEFYVPFYRVADENDGGIRGANIKGGAVRQEAFKKLKGGKDALNADLLDNTLMNWAHLLDASAKNRAAKATIEAAERMGISAPVASGTKNSVWFMDGGDKKHYTVDDPYLMTALTSLEYAGMRNPAMNALGAMKHALTVGVTASPFFKIRNLIRDSMQVTAVSGISANPLKNVVEGWRLTNPQSPEYFRLMAGGGTIHFGTMLEGSEAKRIQALVESGIDEAHILDSDKKVKAFYRKFIAPGVNAYNELGNRGEAVNRASLYKQLKAQGLSHADASLQARDLMDFSMQGSFTSIRFLTQVVPFLNARLQGLYKLGRGAKDEPARFAAVLGTVAIVSVALAAAYGDDEDWKKREEWDRNNNWFFKFGGIAFRIPKPFELGAMGTLAERSFELLTEDEMTGERFRKQVLTLLSDNLSMNPVPQLVKPIIDLYANKDSFSGRPIESMSMERVRSQDRFNDRTSMLARGASTGLNAVTSLVGKDALSPVQIDHMVRAYFGWLGTFVVGSADTLLRPITGQNERTAPDYWRTATGGIIANVEGAPSRYVSQIYDQAKVLEEAYGTYKAMVREGRTEDAGEFALENRDKLIAHKQVNRIKDSMSKINERIRVIERSNMSGEDKRETINMLAAQRDQVARTLPIQ